MQSTKADQALYLARVIFSEETNLAASDEAVKAADAAAAEARLFRDEIKRTLDELRAKHAALFEGGTESNFTGPAWKNPALKPAERARLYFKANPMAKMTAVLLATEIEATAGNLNQVLSRAFASGFLKREAGAYWLDPSDTGEDERDPSHGDWSDDGPPARH